MCVHTYVEAQGWGQEPSFIALNLTYWGRVSHLTLELTGLCNLVSQLAQLVPSLCPYMLETYTACHTHLVGAGDTVFLYV